MSLLDVCQAMFRLNRSTSLMPEPQRRDVYRMKVQLIQWLEESGYCTALNRQDQICEGKSTRLFRFVIEVPTSDLEHAGMFIWHLPIADIDWHVTATGGQLANWTGTGKGDAYDLKNNPLSDAYRVWWFLFTHGRPLSPPFAFGG